MALNKVEICGVNTSKLPVLTAEEKAELFRRIKNGDEQARELYIKGNLRLVLSVIRRFQNSSENADDLFQIGCIGLIKAIDNFDTTLQVKFSTYAVPMITGEIRRFLRDDGMVKVSRSLKENGYKIDNMGMLALYNLIGINQKEDEPMNIGAVKNLIDAAISKSQGGRLFKKNTSKKRMDRDGYIVLYEKDFSGK